MSNDSNLLNAKSGREDILLILEEFLKETIFYVEKANDLEEENKDLKSNIEYLESEVLLANTKLVASIKTVRDFSSKAIDDSTNKVSVIAEILNKNKLAHENVALRLELEQVLMEKRTLGRDLSILKIENEKLRLSRMASERS